MGELPLRRQRCVRASAEAGVRGCCEVPDRFEAGAACVEVPGSSRGSLWSSTRCFFCALVTSAIARAAATSTTLPLFVLSLAMPWGAMYEHLRVVPPGKRLRVPSTSL